MASPIDAQMLLCDAAVADPTGKVHMLGAGWSQTSSPTAPSAVAVMLKIPWDRANQPIPVSLKLLDSDGRPVGVGAPDGSQTPIAHEGVIEVGRPPGVAHGSLLDASFILNLPSLPLPAGRYEWRLDVGNTSQAVSFQVQPPQ